MDRKQAFAIISLAEAGLDVALDYTSRHFFQEEEKTRADINYYRKQTEALWKERFHCKALRKAYEKKYGCDIGVKGLSEALERILQSEDTSTLIDEAMQVLMQDLKVGFSVIENPDMKIVLR